MIYPKKLKKNKIGITALSSGVGERIDSFESSLSNLKKNGFDIVETSNVRSIKNPSSSIRTRVKELNELIEDESIEAILCAAGGDYLIDIIPFVDFEKIKKHPKWYMGASDPTSLLYLITTSCDIATIYGHNAASFDSKNLHISQMLALDILKGKKVTQNSYEKFEGTRENRIDGDYYLDQTGMWMSNQKEINIKGRIIGGCFDCLKDLLKNDFDHTKEFVEKYKKDTMIWYFDIFSLSTSEFRNCLIEMRNKSWFLNISGVILGRVMYKNIDTPSNYEEILKEQFPNIPLIWNTDIGHVPPKMTIINGSVATIHYKDHKGSINFEYI
ncbi:MAG: LD-carboxypeptidase [Bacilli bacterium]|nr:LD-carboxypeptidase [Bacilli bacterium]